MDINIVDIYWDRIYLNIIYRGIDIEKSELFLSSKTQKIKLDVNKIEENKYKSTINITNIDNVVMLKNENYRFTIEKDGKVEEISIIVELGYKLENLDRIYRYSEQNLAYTINFIPKEENNKITCVLVSRFMTINKKYYKEQISGNKNILRKLVYALGKGCLNLLYKISYLLHINKNNKILLMSETRAPIGGNLKALDERIKERGLDKKIKVSYSFFKTLEISTTSLIFKYLKLIWLLSKQEMIFVDDYCPIFKFINLNKKTKLIQLWHAGVGFKSVGYARFGFNGPYPYTSCHRKYDYAVVGGEALIPVYEEVFGISKDKILPYGLPRLDNFLNEDKISLAKEKLYKTYSVLKNKNIILFAPTFRGSGQRVANYPFEKIDLNAVFDLCKEENYVFIIKMHPFVRKRIEIPEEYKDYIIDLSDYPDINELLYITDVLVTDYSSNIYDFSLLNRPIIFYTFDLDFYQIINKVHRPIKKYAPGKVCMEFNKVIEAIRNKDFEYEKLKKFREENFSIHKKTASDLIIDNLILKNNNND